MKKARIGEVKNNLSRYLEHVRKWLNTHRPVKIAGGSLVEDLLEERRTG